MRTVATNGHKQLEKLHSTELPKLKIVTNPYVALILNLTLTISKPSPKAK